MKAIAWILLFAFYFGNGFSQNRSGIFSYTDKIGNHVSIDLSTLPPFLDTTFLKNNTFFDDTTKTHLYSISELNGSKKSKGVFSYDPSIKKWKKKQTLFLKVYMSPLKKIPFLADALSLTGIMHKSILLKKTSKNEWVIEKVMYVSFEI